MNPILTALLKQPSMGVHRSSSTVTNVEEELTIQEPDQNIYSPDSPLSPFAAPLSVRRLSKIPSLPPPPKPTARPSSPPSSPIPSAYSNASPISPRSRAHACPPSPAHLAPSPQPSTSTSSLNQDSSTDSQSQEALPVPSPSADATPETDQVVRAQTLLESLKSARSNATELIGLLAGIADRITKNDMARVVDPNHSAVLQKALFHYARLVAKFVEDLNSRTLTKNTLEEIGMMLFNLQSVKNKIFNFQNQQSSSTTTSATTTTTTSSPFSSSSSSSLLSPSPTPSSPSPSFSPSSTPSVTFANTSPSSSTLSTSTMSSSSPTTISQLTLSSYSSAEQTVDPKSLFHYTATPRVEPSRSSQHLVLSDLLKEYLPPSSDPPSQVRQKFGFKRVLENSEHLTHKPGEASAALVMTLQVLEFTFSSPLESAEDIFIRCEYGSNQSLRTHVSPQVTHKARWLDAPFRFHGQGVSADTGLVVYLQKMSQNLVKTMGILKLEPSTLVESSRTFHEFTNRSNKIGRLLLHIEVFPVFAPLISNNMVAAFDYQSPPPLQGPFSFAVYLKSISLQALISLLLHPSFADPLLQRVALQFLFEYTTLAAFLKECLTIVSGHQPEICIFKLISLIECLLTEHFHAFFFSARGSEDMDSLGAFLKHPKIPSDARTRLLELLDQIRRLSSDFHAQLTAFRDFSESPHAPRKSHFTFLGVDNELLAQQLTLLECEILRRIKPVEFIQWHRDDHATFSPALNYLTSYFNSTSLWIQTEISHQTRKTERVKALKKAMELCCLLRTMQNFNGVMIVSSAINSSAITRLEATFRAIDKDTVASFATARSLMSHEGNFAAYRKALKSIPAGTPCVPYIGIFLTDLRFIMDGQHSSIKAEMYGFTEELLNWGKFAKVFEIIAAIEAFQRHAYYDIPTRSDLQEWIITRVPASADTCHRMSCRVEPTDYQSLVEDLILNELQLQTRVDELERLLAAQSSPSQASHSLSTPRPISTPRSL